MDKLTDEMTKILTEHCLGYVASVDKGGMPNLSPKATFLPYSDDKIMFGEIRSPNTVRNILINPIVEINFVDVITRRGFRCKGPATYYARGSNRFEELYVHYRDSRPIGLCKLINGIVLVEIKYASLITSPAYDAGATVDKLREEWSAYYSGLGELDLDR